MVKPRVPNSLKFTQVLVSKKYTTYKFKIPINIKNITHKILSLFQIFFGNCIALLLSFYFFIDILVFKNKDHSPLFSTWQFPMLLAIFVDTIYGL